VTFQPETTAGIDQDEMWHAVAYLVLVDAQI